MIQQYPGDKYRETPLDDQSNFKLAWIAPQELTLINLLSSACWRVFCLALPANTEMSIRQISKTVVSVKGGLTRQLPAVLWLSSGAHQEYQAH